MPGFDPRVQRNWLIQYEQPVTETKPKKKHFWSFCWSDHTTDVPILRIPVPQQRVQPSFEQELILGLQRYAPQATKSGVNGSFFLCDSKGSRAAIFKPMNMEAGAKKNHRLDYFHNVQFRDSILPGQGAGNEVLAYALDSQAFGGRYGIPKTLLTRLTHAAFEGEEVGSAQVFLPDTRALADLTVYERSLIPVAEWEKLNFRLISGSTDAHFGNILFCNKTGKLYLIDSGDDFVGPEGQHQYYNPWALEPRCQLPMSESENHFLARIDIPNVMTVFEHQALFNQATHQRLEVSTEKYLTQYLRLILAKVVGQQKLTQSEWASMLSPRKGSDGLMHPGYLERIYSSLIQDRFHPGAHWRDAVRSINWDQINNQITSLALSIKAKRAPAVMLQGC